MLASKLEKMEGLGWQPPNVSRCTVNESNTYRPLWLERIVLPFQTSWYSLENLSRSVQKLSIHMHAITCNWKFESNSTRVLPHSLKWGNKPYKLKSSIVFYTYKRGKRNWLILKYEKKVSKVNRHWCLIHRNFATFEVHRSNATDGEQ